jgi:pimeloyl-ACP methyl ester carboxylesterase
MDLRRFLGVATLGTVGVVAATRALRRSAGALEPPLDGVHHTFRWRGMDVAYTEAGDPSDPDLVCLHGVNAAGSSGEFRAVFDDLAETHHVVAVDLPGFGLSDRPPLRYSAALYEDFLADFLAEFEAPTVVASGLTGAYAVAAARDDQDLVERFVLVCPTAVAGPEPPRTWLRELLRAPLLGEALFALLASKPSIRHFNADHGYYDTGKLSASWTAYEWRTAHQPGARFAPASFVSGHLNADIDLGRAIAELPVPTTLVWGREATVTPLAEGRAVAERSGARLVVVDDAMLLPHVEYPSTLVGTVREDSHGTAATGVDVEE